jgi:hypothetical protein
MFSLTSIVPRGTFLKRSKNAAQKGIQQKDGFFQYFQRDQGWKRAKIGDCDGS